MTQWFMSEMVAQHDAVIVAWREKRRQDLVRLITILRHLWKGHLAKAFLSQEIGVKEVSVDDFEPLIPTQPHSEFPSGSAVICQASLENLRTAFDNKFGRNFTEPPAVIRVVPANFVGLPNIEGLNVTFDLVLNSLREAAERCGESRLYAGVHFPPSVREGLRLGKGIGRKAFKQIDALARGVVPDNCNRCLRREN